MLARWTVWTRVLSSSPVWSVPFLETASIPTGLMATQDPMVQFYTPSNSAFEFHFCAVLFHFELFALEAILCLLIFMFWWYCTGNDLDLLRFLKSVEWCYTKAESNFCAICVPVMQNCLLSDYCKTASRRNKKEWNGAEEKWRGIKRWEMYETITGYSKFTKPRGSYNNTAFLMRLLHVPSPIFFHFHNTEVVTSS